MSKDTNISAQVAIKSAAKLFQGTGDVDGAAQAAARFYQGIISLGGDPDVGADGQTNMQRAQGNLQNGGVQSTVARDLSNEEARWRDALDNNPDDWYNNVGDSRASSGGGRGPDFKFKDESANVKALWLNGQYGPAPAWVFERLNLPFPGGSQQQQSIQSAPAQQQQEPVTGPSGQPVPF